MINIKTQSKKNFKKFIMNDDSTLKRFAKYLLDNYKNSKFSINEQILIDLNQFYKEGRIKNTIHKKDKKSKKIRILNDMKNKILNDTKIKYLLNYNDFKYKS